MFLLRALSLLSKTVILLLIIVNIASIIAFKNRKSKDFLMDSLLTALLAHLLYATGF